MAKCFLHRGSITISVISAVVVRNAIKQSPWIEDCRVTHLSIPELLFTTACFEPQRSRKVIHNYLAQAIKVKRGSNITLWHTRPDYSYMAEFAKPLLT